MYHKSPSLPPCLLLTLTLLLWPLVSWGQTPAPPAPDAPTEQAGEKNKKDTPATAPTSKPVPAEQEEEEEEEEEDDDDEEVEDFGLDAAPFTEEQKKFLKEWSQKFKGHVLGQVPKPVPPKLSLKWRAETYSKILYQNDQSQGSVTFGTPHPRGDNYAGSNGFASELVLYLDGQVSDKVEVGARIKSRFHRQWADFYENGDLAVDKTSGEPTGVDSTGESLGANHAAYIQLRGLYLRMSPPIPTIKSILFGSSDLGMFNAWTVGKVRYIDRDNANGIFVNGGFWNIEYTLARISLPKLYSSAGWNSGIDDPLVQNPFWTRDASYALKIAQQPVDWLDWNLVTSYLLDEEADLNDPDTLGSTNFVDKRDGVVATLPRYQNINSTLEVAFQRWKLDGNIMVAFSRSDPDLDYVFNSVDGNQGISPIPMKTANSYAAKARIDLLNLVDGLDIRLEYFNIGSDWVATFGARRETDVLLTDGFLDGQVPTLNIANEFIDFRDEFFEAIVGWHGATLSPKYVRGALEAELELTFIEYNTDDQDRCTRNELSDENGARIESQVCPQDASTGKFYGVYPDFLFPDGMTDTDFFSYANTNDRGRDPRAVYRQNQARRTYLGMLKVGYQFGIGRGLRWDTKLKYILDQDLRDLDLEQDDYLGHLIFFQTRFGTQLTDELSVALGFKFDWWDEQHRSRKGSTVDGKPSYPDYRTLKTNVFLDLKYQFGGATLGWYMEWLNKDVRITRENGTEHPDSFAFRNVVRGIGTISASF